MAVKLPIYMADNHATTPVDPRVLEAMLPYFSAKFGNAASRNHEFGWKAEEAVETGRGQVARLIGASPREIVFTSGATESNNLAIKGVAEMYRGRGNHIITQVTEHKAVIDVCHSLEKLGFEVTYLPVGRDGLHRPRRLAPRHYAEDDSDFNHVRQQRNWRRSSPLPKIGKIAKESDALFHVDAAQAVGKIPVDVQKDGIDLLSISAHKLYGPKGVGALYVRRKDPHVAVAPMMDGGGHERGMRSGTLNVPGIVGMGKACEICQKEMAEESARLRRRLPRPAERGALLAGLR